MSVLWGEAVCQYGQDTLSCSSLISLLPAPWKTLEGRTCLMAMFTESSAVFQCLLENSQLIVKTGTVLMLGFWSDSSQSMEVWTTQSTRRLFAEYKKVEISECFGALPFYLLSKLFQWLYYAGEHGQGRSEHNKKGKAVPNQHLNQWI